MHVLPLLLLAFVVVPIVELAVIIQVGTRIGALPTIVLLLFDSVLGAVLVKREGRRAWRAFRSALEEGRWPGDEVVQGALVLVGGALLVTPGFLTDVIGLLAVLRPTRALASRYLRRRLTPAPLRRALILERRRPKHERGASSAAPPSGRPPKGPGRAGRTGQVLDVEVVSVERQDDTEAERTGESPRARPSAGPGDHSTRAHDRRVGGEA